LSNYFTNIQKQANLLFDTKLCCKFVILAQNSNFVLMMIQIPTHNFRTDLEQILFLIFTTLLIFLFGNRDGMSQDISGNNQGSARIAFYNVENLFDVYDDSLTRDEEFTPEGPRHWNNNKFYKKINNTYKVIMALSESGPPAIVGLCETENRFVLKKLVYDTPLKNFNYRIIQFESPDWRGIDVALLYRANLFEPLFSVAIPVLFPFDTASRTRDILYVKGVLLDADTINIFVNHWPSRYGGYMPTVPKRNFAAQVLKNKTDSILRINENAAILIMGDFNDGPQDESLSEVLVAKNPANYGLNNELYNLMLTKQDDWHYGSLKYQQGWNRFDMMIVSGGLLDDTSALHISGKKATIFHAPFLLEIDKTHLGQKPNRTYIGFKYHGGFSDHLPVYLDIKVNRSKP
jgi:endonuclease/exonuclease/phosphatase family metal-dependent hydrolase